VKGLKMNTLTENTNRELFQKSIDAAYIAASNNDRQALSAALDAASSYIGLDERLKQQVENVRREVQRMLPRQTRNIRLVWCWHNRQLGARLREAGFNIANENCNEYAMNIARRFSTQYHAEIYEIIAEVENIEVLE
jgi:hypothetical protein